MIAIISIILYISFISIISIKAWDCAAENDGIGYLMWTIFGLILPIIVAIELTL